MLRKLPIGLVVVFAVALATNMLAKEPDKEEPLRKRVFIPGSVEVTLTLLHTELVREEIGMTDAQMAKIEPLIKEMRDAYDKIYRDNPETSESQKEDLDLLEFGWTKVVKAEDGSVTRPKSEEEGQAGQDDVDSSRVNPAKSGFVVSPCAPPRNSHPPRRSQRDIRIAQATEEADKGVQKQLDEILQPRQLDRIWEIILQLDCLGSETFFRQPELDEELYKLLAISDDQVEKIRDIHAHTEHTMTFVGIRPIMPDTMEELPIKQRREIIHEKCEKMRPILDRADEKVQAVLTRKQRDTIAKMKGKEVDRIKLFEQLNGLNFEFEQSQETAGGEEKKDN